MYSRKILEVYKKCNIRSFPIDCEKILSQYGYRIKTYSELLSQSIEAGALAKELSNDSFTDRVNRIIAYNDGVHKNRSRFSLMHELGHIVFGHTNETAYNEEVANEFASNILAPRPAIMYFSCSTAQDIHDVFGLSYMASNRALADYRSWVHQASNEYDYELRELISSFTVKNQDGSFGNVCYQRDIMETIAL